MTAQNIIEKWLEYSNYNPDEHRFVLGSSHYEMHKISTGISSIMEYDPQCVLSVLYVKTKFEELCKTARTTLFDVLNESTGLEPGDYEMWKLLHSADVMAVENEILNRMSDLLQKGSQLAQIGERDLEKERGRLADAVISVVEELCKCHVDLFLRGGVIQPIDRFDTQLHVFNTLSECLVALEKAPDAAYVCFVSNNGTADGYFGFYIKSNGNILSVNERINEAYPGQHNHSRNGRWMESKKINLFPYELISGEHFDYKGYARTLILDDSELELFKLAPECYLPLTLGLVMLNNKYAYVDPTTMPLKLVDALLPANLRLAAKQDKALIPLENSLVAKVAEEYRVPFTAEDVLSGSPASLYNSGKDQEKSYEETGDFLTEENIFVTLYGEGFKLDTADLLIQGKYKQLPSSSVADPRSCEDTVEFVGTTNRLDMIAYYKARQQLAEYIRDRMFEEYLAFGGVNAVQLWYDKAVADAKDRLIDLCVQKWEAVKSGEQKMLDNMQWQYVEKQGLDYIRFFENTKGHLDYEKTGGVLRARPFNKIKVKANNILLCPVTGAVSSINFILRPDSWLDMEEMLGVEVPKILKGYQRDSYRSIGNSILSATDAVAEVGNVFETNENQVNRRLWTSYHWHEHYFHHSSEYPDWPRKEAPEAALKDSPTKAVFAVEIAFSKRGWAKVLSLRDPYERESGLLGSSGCPAAQHSTYGQRRGAKFSCRPRLGTVH